MTNPEENSEFFFHDTLDISLVGETKGGNISYCFQWR